MAEINPYAAPQTSGYVPNTESIQAEPESMEGLFRHQNLLVMYKGTTLPDRCIKSNLPAHGARLRRKLYWHNPLLYLTNLWSPIAYLIAREVFSRKVTIEMGISQQWALKRRRAINLGSIVCAAGVLLAFASFIFMHELGIWLGAAVAIGGVLYGHFMTRLIAPVLISKDCIWIKGVHPEFLAGLPVWDRAAYNQR